MPWKILSLGQGRSRLVKLLWKAQEPVAKVCRRFGISRPTAYKWKRRFLAEGRRGLRNRSRRPRHSPRQIPRRWVQAIRRLRRRQPDWGGKKIRAYLGARHRRQRLPAVRTITRYLQRWQRTRRRRVRAPKGPAVRVSRLTVARRSNQVWTVDFKGWFRTGDGQRVEPLTVRDLFSRYVLAVRLLPDQSWWRVRARFIRLFGRYGLPRVIRVDNGGPFASVGPAGLSRLSAWWTALGVRVEFIRPGCPQDNGAHEQMHGILKRQATQPVSSTLRAQQRRLNRWVQIYNQVRPHEALGQRPPARYYRRAARKYVPEPKSWNYPKAWRVRSVRRNGQIRWQGRLRFVGEAFIGYRVALRPKSVGVWTVYFAGILIGELRTSDTGSLRPVTYIGHHRTEAKAKV